MDKIIYDKINEYCNKKMDRVLVQAERDYILRKFLDSYYDAVEKNIEVNNSDPTDEEKRMILNSLLNDSTLLSYSDSAKSYYEEIRRSIENDFQKSKANLLFWQVLQLALWLIWLIP